MVPNPGVGEKMRQRVGCMAGLVGRVGRVSNTQNIHINTPKQINVFQDISQQMVLCIIVHMIWFWINDLHLENASLTLSGMALPSGREFKRLRHATDPYRSFVRSYVRTFARTFVRSFVRFFVRPFTPRGWRETLPKRVSDDSQSFIFRCQKQFCFQQIANFGGPLTPEGWLRLT